MTTVRPDGDTRTSRFVGVSWAINVPIAKFRLVNRTSGTYTILPCGPGSLLATAIQRTASWLMTLRAVLDTGQYSTGINYSEDDIAALPLVRHDFHFHGDWNCALLPHAVGGGL